LLANVCGNKGVTLMADERERQTSNKAGVRSLGQKLDNTRHGFDEHPGSRKTAGAFGREPEQVRSEGEEEDDALPEKER
jgi:hypothetical protein